jgi:hypothetical protein
MELTMKLLKLLVLSTVLAASVPVFADAEPDSIVVLAKHTQQKPDAAALGRLGLTGPAGDVLLLQADFAVTIKDTALAGDAKDFDGDRIPIHVSLVMRHTSG